MSDKHTKRELFETLLVFASAAEADAWVIEGLEHELDLLDRKRATKGVDAKKAAEQAAATAVIRDTLAGATEPMRAGEVAKVTDLSVQRVSAMLRKMVLSGEVSRIEDKKVTTFSLT